MAYLWELEKSSPLLPEQVRTGAVGEIAVSSLGETEKEETRELLPGVSSNRGCRSGLKGPGAQFRYYLWGPSISGFRDEGARGCQRHLETL